MEFKSLKNIETSFRQIRLFALVFVCLCAVAVSYTHLDVYKRQREVLPAVMGSDVWDAMLDEFEGVRQRVARLMNNNNV